MARLLLYPNTEVVPLWQDFPC